MIKKLSLTFLVFFFSSLYSHDGIELFNSYNDFLELTTDDESTFINNLQWELGCLKKYMYANPSSAFFLVALGIDIIGARYYLKNWKKDIENIRYDIEIKSLLIENLRTETIPLNYVRTQPTPTSPTDSRLTHEGQAVHAVYGTFLHKIQNDILQLISLDTQIASLLKEKLLLHELAREKILYSVAVSVGITILNSIVTAVFTYDYQLFRSKLKEAGKAKKREN